MNVMLHIINNHLCTKDSGEWLFDVEPEDLVEKLSEKFKVTLKNLNKGVLVKVEKHLMSQDGVFRMLKNQKPLQSDIFKDVMDNFESLLMVDNIRIGTRLSDGSIIFAKMGDHWIACAPATMRTQSSWGLCGIGTGLPNVTSGNDPNTGFSNSSVLYEYGSLAEANQWCMDKGGYFLPNKEELLILYQNRDLIDANDTSGGTYTLNYIATNGVGPNGTSPYCWSSTEYDSYDTWVVYMGHGYMGNGVSYTNGKSDPHLWVCPCTMIKVI